jgi:hypothetical protein
MCNAAQSIPNPTITPLSVYTTIVLRESRRGGATPLAQIRSDGERTYQLWAGPAGLADATRDSLVRKMLSFSKKVENHIGAIWYFVHQDNASRPLWMETPECAT